MGCLRRWLRVVRGVGEWSWRLLFSDKISFRESGRLKSQQQGHKVCGTSCANAHWRARGNLERVVPLFMKQSVAVVILTFNRLKLLQRCIKHVREQTRRVDGVIVVNNGSTDGTKEWLDEQADIIAIH